MNDYSNNLETLKLANDTRKFEIELFWKRNNHFWLINAAALAAYVVLADKKLPGISIVVACYGLVTSFSWILICHGSKWWQESWEAKVKQVEATLSPQLFSKPIPPDPTRELFGLKIQRFSVTGLATALATFTFIIWGALIARSLSQDFLIGCLGAHHLHFTRRVIVVGFSLAFCGWIYEKTKVD